MSVCSHHCKIHHLTPQKIRHPWLNWFSDIRLSHFSILPSEASNDCWRRMVNPADWITGSLCDEVFRIQRIYARHLKATLRTPKARAPLAWKGSNTILTKVELSTRCSTLTSDIGSWGDLIRALFVSTCSQKDLWEMSLEATNRENCF